MPKDLHFAHETCVALAPGEAVEVRAGEILVSVPDEIATTLLKRLGVKVAGPDLDARKVTIAQRRLPSAKAAQVSPHLDRQRIIDDRKRELEARKALADWEKEIGKEGSRP